MSEVFLISFLIIFLRNTFVVLLIPGFWVPAKKVKEAVRKTVWQNCYYSLLFGYFRGRRVLHYAVEAVDPTITNVSETAKCVLDTLFSHTVRFPVCQPLVLWNFAALFLSKHPSLFQLFCSDSSMEVNTVLYWVCVVEENDCYCISQNNSGFKSKT